MARGRLTYGAGKKRLSCWRVMLLVVVICSLVQMGCLFWFGNCRALISDNDSTTMVDIAYLLTDHVDGDLIPDALDAADTGPDPLTGDFVVGGNGTRDDNREESFFFHRATRAMALPRKMAAVSGFRDRRTAVAYKDFGHLKVMSAGEAASDSFAFQSLDLKPRPPVYCIAGGLLYFKMSCVHSWNNPGLA